MQSVVSRSTALDDILQLALREPSVRIRPLLGPNGERLWLKRIEDLSPRLRLQKGSGRRAFANELRGLHALGKAGLPVPAVLSEGPDHFVMADVGRTLGVMLNNRATTSREKAAAFRATGTAIGQLHCAGFVHGRPAVRDICWDGEYARFIDLERFSDGAASTWAQSLDVIMFVQTYFTARRNAGPELDVAMEAYRAAAPAGSWASVQRLAARLALLLPLAAVLKLVNPRSKELLAAPLTLAYLRR